VLGCEPLDDAPILDLRIRKGVRRQGVRLALATPRPSALDAGAELAVRFAPAGAEALVLALGAALGGDGDLDELAGAAGADAAQVRALAQLLSGAGEHVVVLWGEGVCTGPRAAHAARALLNLAGALKLDGVEGAGLLEVPASANGRGLREAGVLPGCGPGLADSSAEGMGAAAIASALAGGELGALYLLGVDPLRTHPDRPAWQAALAAAPFVVAHAATLSAGVAEHADVIFPCEAYAEKEGTVTHPDGRLQRLRPAIGRPRGVRAEWQVLAELCTRLGLDLELLTAAMATAQLIEAVGFYDGITLEEIGGNGVRWPAREAAGALAEGDQGPFEPESPQPGGDPGQRLRLGTFRSLWASPEVEASPALAFLAAEQRAEMSPADAERLGIGDGQQVEVSVNGSRLRAVASLRAAIPPGSVFLAEAIAEGAANALTNGQPRLVEVRPA